MADAGLDVRGMLTLDQLRKRIPNKEIDTVVVGFTDHYGRLMGKRYDADRFVDSIAEDGAHGCDYLLTTDMEMDPVRGYRFANWELGYGDFHLVPDMTTLRIARIGTPRRFLDPLVRAGAQVVFFNPPDSAAGWGSYRVTIAKCSLSTIASRSPAASVSAWNGRAACSRKGVHRGAIRRCGSKARRRVISAMHSMTCGAERGCVSGGIRLHRHVVRAARGAHIDPSMHPPSLVGIIEGVPLRLRVSRALQLQALASEKTIWIASAYFMPLWSEMEALAGAARDGVDVRVLVPRRYDHPWLRRLTTRFYRRLCAMA